MADSKIFCQEWLAFEKELGFRPMISSSTVEGIRKQDGDLGAALVEKYAAHFPPPDPTITLAEHKTASGVRIKTYTPSNAQQGRPIACWFHGGGFVVGGVDLDDPLVSRMARDTGLVFASVEYRLAPENRYPAAFEDGLEAAGWCAENAEFLKTDGSVICIGGSAGASLALGTALKLIDVGQAAILKGVVAIQPGTLHPDAVPSEYQEHYSSYDEHSMHTINSQQAMRAFFGEKLHLHESVSPILTQVLAEIHGASKTDPYVGCLNHTRLKELPRVYISAAECDTLRDDARLLKRTLDSFGVANTYDEYTGLPHYFFVFPSPLLAGPIDEFHAKTAAGIGFVLAG